MLCGRVYRTLGYGVAAATPDFEDGTRMSSPEASIEEILASIRKTFTDEPEAPAAKAEPAASESRPFGMPAFRSASEATSANLSTSSLPIPPRSRASAIDDELEDLIDKPTSVGASEIKQPDPPSQASNGSSAPPPSPVEAAREKWANLLNPHTGPANGATAKAAEPKPEPLSQPAPPAPAPAASSGLFAPRKGGFYPPQDSRPEPVLSMPSASPEPSVAKPAEAAVVAPAPPSRTSFIPFWQPSTAPVSSPSEVAPNQAASVDVPAGLAPPETEPVKPAAAAEVPAASARALDHLVAELNGAGLSNPEPPVTQPTGAPAPLKSAAAIAEQAAFKVAAQAAARVAAADAGAQAVSAPPVASDPTPEVAASPTSSGSRSFEDVVADMLRPLLEKWIDENMPRIVERALQRDAALGRKPGP
jgi:cell pole-organizing protein PopZ